MDRRQDNPEFLGSKIDALVNMMGQNNPAIQEEMAKDVKSLIAYMNQNELDKKDINNDMKNMQSNCDRCSLSRESMRTDINAIVNKQDECDSALISLRAETKGKAKTWGVVIAIITTIVTVVSSVIGALLK